MSELERILKPLMEIADDETFCTQEYEAIKDYIEEKDFIGVTTEYWDEIAFGGYDVVCLIECYVPELPKEKKLNMAKQIWQELADVPTVETEYDLLIDADFRCWHKGATVEELWQDIEHWFGVSVAIDLMRLE